jgi:hypothetical protein
MKPAVPFFIEEILMIEATVSRENFKSFIKKTLFYCFENLRFLFLYFYLGFRKLAKNATKPNPFEIISLRTTRKKNNWKTEETLARTVVTLETKLIEGSNP